MAHDVFISHSSRDKAIADAACARLEQAGHRCWMAPRDILPGKSWGEAIVEGISEARIFILIFSDHANRSPQVLREIERAVAKGLVIVPFRIEDVAPSQSLEYFMSAPHWLDALTSPMEKHFAYLADVVGRLLGGEALPATSPPRAAPAPGPAPPAAASLVRAGAAIAAIAAVPLAAALTALAPPWPDGIGYVSAVLVLLASAAAWEWARRGRLGRRGLWIALAAVLTLIGLIAYLILYSMFVEPIPGTSIRVVRGFVCTSDALLVYGAACPDLPRDALRDAEWESVMLWTRSSVTIVRVSLLASWLVFTAGLMATGAAILARRRTS